MVKQIRQAEQRKDSELARKHSLVRPDAALAEDQPPAHGKERQEPLRKAFRKQYGSAAARQGLSVKETRLSLGDGTARLDRHAVCLRTRLGLPPYHSHIFPREQTEAAELPVTRQRGIPFLLALSLVHPGLQTPEKGRPLYLSRKRAPQFLAVKVEQILRLREFSLSHQLFPETHDFAAKTIHTPLREKIQIFAGAEEKDQFLQKPLSPETAEETELSHQLFLRLLADFPLFRADLHRFSVGVALQEAKERLRILPKTLPLQHIIGRAVGTELFQKTIQLGRKDTALTLCLPLLPKPPANALQLLRRVRRKESAQIAALLHGAEQGTESLHKGCALHTALCHKCRV